MTTGREVNVDGQGAGGCRSLIERAERLSKSTRLLAPAFNGEDGGACVAIRQVADVSAEQQRPQQQSATNWWNTMESCWRLPIRKERGRERVREGVCLDCIGYQDTEQEEGDRRWWWRWKKKKKMTNTKCHLLCFDCKNKVWRTFDERWTENRITSTNRNVCLISQSK